MTRGDDEAPACVEHVWGLGGVHLSLARGAETEETCSRCGALRYTTGGPNTVAGDADRC